MGGLTTNDLIDHNLALGGTAIPTTYAVDGYTKTRYHEPLIYDPKEDLFYLQVHFPVPVEAIVTVRPDQLPLHVTENPSGFGFDCGDGDKESEISFFDWIPPEFITTNFSNLKKQLLEGTYSRQTINLETRSSE